MYFFSDNKKKILFGWSFKCGCTHIKNILKFLVGPRASKMRIKDVRNKLPKKYNDYKIIMFIRNPYKRLISGFLDKYVLEDGFKLKIPIIKPNPKIKPKTKTKAITITKTKIKINSKKKITKYISKNKITFEKFVDELIKHKYRTIDKYHFIPQTEEYFKQDMKIDKIFEIGKIDYKYIEDLYEKKIPTDVLNYRGYHIVKYETNTIGKSYGIPIGQLKERKIMPSVKSFFSDKIKKKVYNFYEKDFIFINNHGFNTSI